MVPLSNSSATVNGTAEQNLILTELLRSVNALDAKIDNQIKAGLALEAKVETLDTTLAALNSAAVPVFHNPVPHKAAVGGAPRELR